ncbi:MAG TPA: hypothetical protein QF353_00285 [Gammaproteobacteria bacterium]|nr:hypothetical protein [Gammaproteobacteria bacterium]
MQKKQTIKSHKNTPKKESAVCNSRKMMPPEAMAGMDASIIKNLTFEDKECSPELFKKKQVDLIIQVILKHLKSFPEKLH